MKKTLPMRPTQAASASNRCMPDPRTNVSLTPSGLDRRLKRHFLKAEHRFLAVTTPPFEEELEKEIRAWLPEAGIGEVLPGGVEFSGPVLSVYQANLKLRTATRVLLRIDSFVAKSYPELFNKARRVPWELYAGFGEAVAFDAVSRASRLHHTGNIVKAVSDAFAEKMASLGVAAARQSRDAALRFFTRIADDACTISIDSSGDMLYKRGYRLETAFAPLRETIAAALLQRLRWWKFGAIADPLCGSGTFIIEAACMARGMAPGIGRRFAFFSWPSFKPAVLERLRRDAAAAEKSMTALRLFASDISPRAAASAKSNAARAGVASSIDVRCGTCFDFNRDGGAGDKGLIVSNLPYGKRAAASGGDLRAFYGRWGMHLKTYCRGWTYGFLTADPSFLHHSGLPGTAAARFENGGIPVSLVSGTID